MSYASQDADAAARICASLRAAGIEVWFDQSELRGGDVWDQKIRLEIRDAALFIPIISRNTQTRTEGYFRLEWRLADQRTHLMAMSRAFLVPVCIDDTRDADAEVPDSFSTVQWTRLPAGDTPPVFVERVSRLLSQSEHITPTDSTVPDGASVHVHSAATEKFRIHGASSRLSPALWLIAAAVVIAVGYFAIDRILTSKRFAAAGPTSAPTAHPVTPAQNGIPEKSIAVLPFADMSEKKDQEYFSDGLSEELIDLLTKVPDLRVPARTSSFFFKGKSEDIATIAQKLRVAHVLEGSVRKAGNTIRVTTQLIRADNGYHLWSETYDRDLKDVFKVQDEIAGAVVAALKLKLTSRQRTPNSHRTANPEAYNQYLLGRKFLERVSDADDFRHAVAAYRKAIQLDPGYVVAYAELATAELDLANLTGDAAGKRIALALAEKAVTLAPDEADGYTARGYLRSFFSWDWTGAQADFEKALAFDSENSYLQWAYAGLLTSLGRLPEAIAAGRKATELDPLAAYAWTILGWHLTENREYPAAHEALRRSLEIQPELTDTITNLGILQLLEGKGAEALATFRQIRQDDVRLPSIAMAEHTLGHAKESQYALDEAIAKGVHNAEAYEIAEVYAWRGEKDKAFEWLERAYQQRERDLSAAIKADPLLASLHGDPRYTAMLRKMGLPG